MDDRDPLTQLVIGAAIEVHREIGPGLLESIYQKCMIRELQLRRVEFLPKAKVLLAYKGEPLDTELEMDLLFSQSARGGTEGS